MFKGEPFKTRTIYLVCNSRDQLENLVDALRDEGFKSPDFRALVGLPSTPSLRPSIASMHADRWIAGIPATLVSHPAPHNAAPHNLAPKNSATPFEPALYEYLSRGGLLLEVLVSSVTQMQICTEVSEDFGTEWLESRALRSESSSASLWDGRKAA